MKKRYFIVPIVMGLFFASGSLAAERREKLAGEIQEMISDLSCDTDAQCRSFGFGDKPCGGFWEYRLYSIKTVDEQELLQKAERYKVLDEKHNKAGGMASTCDVVQPLRAACIGGYCVSMGDDLNYVTPLHSAAAQNDITLMEDLLQQGEDINGLSAHNETPLLYALQSKVATPETITFLIENGADVNFKHDAKSNTALIYAVTEERPAMVQILLEHGADPHLSNHWGSALDYAVELNNQEILDLLKNKGYK